MDFSTIVLSKEGAPRYEQLARWIETAIADGSFAPGARLPTVRRMAAELRVSVTTVNAAFELLATKQLIQPQVGRGTFVTERSGAISIPAQEKGFSRVDSHGRLHWRRRSLMSSGARLRAVYPTALECSTGRPDPGLLPVDAIKSAWNLVGLSLTPRDLQYAGPGATERLGSVLIPLLEADLVGARVQDLLIGNSAQQFLMLALELVSNSGYGHPVVGVEEPGYPTSFDTYERCGARLIGIQVDNFGAVPESLLAALKSGARAVLLTPRGHNPTGASWTRERKSELADILASFPDVMILEDDHFAGMATTRPGSLITDARLENRVLYVRSFSKSLAPDLRIAVGVARPALHEALADAKSFSDGWTSRLLQGLLAEMLGGEEVHAALDHARTEYGHRREAAAKAVNQILRPYGGGTWCGPDGLNLWVKLPPGTDAKDVVQRSAEAGVRVADGEAFFLSPGHRDFVRLNAGSVNVESAARAGRLLAESALACAWSKPGPIHV